jgi:hypothetical protein
VVVAVVVQAPMQLAQQVWPMALQGMTVQFVAVAVLQQTHQAIQAAQEHHSAPSRAAQTPTSKAQAVTAFLGLPLVQQTRATVALVQPVTVAQAAQAAAVSSS